MPVVASTLPALRPELVIKPLGDQGQYVVKDPRTGAYFTVGRREHFLFTRLDGRQSGAAICAAYGDQFGETLAEEDLDGFVQAAREQGLLVDCGVRCQRARKADGHVGNVPHSLLHWRKSLWDPDRCFGWLAPKVRFFWTRGFVLFSAACIVTAAVLCWGKRAELAGSFDHALRWETLLLVWLVLTAVTFLHECAHGLTCKHYGGEVHEIGFLLLYLLPGFYCNVSDAWLFREKSKRLWVTFAGGYFELFFWSLAVFVWCVTVPYSLVNYLAFVVVSLCGVQTLFNFTPLLKLDGYYLLSDWLELPNLHQRAGDTVKAHGRRLLWGANRPERPPRARLLLCFGLASWLFSFGLLALVLAWLFEFVRPRFGLVGVSGVAVLGFVSMGKLLQGFAAGEVRQMILLRYKRTIGWVLALAALAAVLCFVEIEDRAGGTFQVRAALRTEVRAPLCGFIKAVLFDEGDRVSPGAIVVQLDVPDLASRLAQKRAELCEAQAHLRRLANGPRPEEVAQQRSRVERAQAWRELAEKDLTQARLALNEELARHDQQIAQGQAEVNAAHGALLRSRSLRNQQALADAEFAEADKQFRVCAARLAQLQAEKRARAALGILKAQDELARRTKEVADAKTDLVLLELGTLPEEIEAQRARVARLGEESAYLDGLPAKLAVGSSIAGVVCTARLREKVGQYVREGDLVCVVEEPAALEAEIVLDEDAVSRVRPGQAVALKPRVLPLANIAAQVQRIAPVTTRADGQNTLTVYCLLAPRPESCAAEVGCVGMLRSGMTGHARIATGARPLGAILAERTVRYLRIESWWWF